MVFDSDGDGTNNGDIVLLPATRSSSAINRGFGYRGFGYRLFGYRLRGSFDASRVLGAAYVRGIGGIGRIGRRGGGRRGGGGRGGCMYVIT